MTTTVLDEHGLETNIQCEGVPDTCDNGIQAPTGLLPDLVPITASPGGGLNLSASDPVVGMCFLDDNYFQTTHQRDDSWTQTSCETGSCGQPNALQGIASNRNSWCGGTADFSTSCNVPGSQHSPPSQRVDLSWADELRCPKREPDSLTAQCGNSDAEGRSLVGAYCALWTSSAQVFGVPGGTYHYVGSVPGESVMPVETCFARATTTTGQTCINADRHLACAPCDPSLRDPGVDIWSDLYDIVAGADSHVDVTSGTTVTSYALSGGTGDIETRPAVTVPGPSPAEVLFSNITITVDPASNPPLPNMGISLGRTWVALQTANPLVYDLDPATTVAIVGGSNGSNYYGRELTASTSPTPTVTVDGTDLLLYLHTVDGYDVETADVYARFRPRNIRPTAAIASITPATLQECPGPQGVAFTFTGIASTTNTSWTVSGMPDYAYGATSFTLQVPVSGPNDASHVVVWSAIANGRTANDSATVRVVDTTPPVATVPTFAPDCGWDSNPGETNPQIPALCLHPVPAGRDLCDAAPVPVIEAITAYDASGNQVATCQGSSCNCLAAPPGYLNANVQQLSWRMTWHEADHSGNNSPTYLTEFTVAQDPPVIGGCQAPHHVNVLYNGPNPAVLYEFDNLPPGAITIPAGLTFTRASSATVQTGASTVVTSGIGTNVARVGNDGNGHVGLVLEEARTNLVADSRNMGGASWFTGTGVTTLDATAGPDGIVDATRTLVGSGQFSNYFFTTSVSTSGPYTVSEWLANTSGSGLFDFSVNLGGAVKVVGGTATSAYERLVLTGVPTAAWLYAFPVGGTDQSAWGGLTAGSRDNLVDLVQVESGEYATETIVTTGSTATRAGDFLSVASASSLLDGGRLSLEFRLQPKGRLGAYPSSGIGLWTVDAANWAAFDPSSGTLYVYAGGVVDQATLSPALSWNALDTVEIYVSTGGGVPTEVQYRINGGVTQTAAVTGGTPPTLSLTGPIQLLCHGTASQFTSYVQHIAVLSRTTRPTWLN